MTLLPDDFTSVSLLLARREGADIICISSGAYGVLLPSTPEQRRGSEAGGQEAHSPSISLYSLSIVRVRVLPFDKMCTTHKASSNFFIIGVMSVYQ